MYCELVVPSAGRGATHEFEACDHVEGAGTAGAPKLTGQLKELDAMLEPAAYKGTGDATIVLVAYGRDKGAGGRRVVVAGKDAGRMVVAGKMEGRGRGAKEAGSTERGKALE